MSDQIEKTTKPAQVAQTAEGQPVASEVEIISREKLLEAGTYFGHRVSQWNPKMKQYIWGKRMGIHIIDISKTQKTLEYAYKLLNKMAQKPISFIWVGTKKQAKKAIEAAALRTNSVYVSERWLGGTLTNSQTIFRSVKELERLEELQANGYQGYTKKEGLLFDKKIAKLQKNLGGIRKLAGKATFPQVMICASPLEDEIAIAEAKKKGIKIFAIQDTNSNPDLVDFAIPANDDSVKSITVVTTILADAICAARGEAQLFAYKSNDEIVLPEEPKREYTQRKFQRRPQSGQEQTTTTTEVKETTAESK
ncbi:Vegetative protein 209 [Metamycoplasma arthritidis]|uniref:30S ribosomal protein S2 n=1 Tax=Metamycoplasma arthritidis TaxID=2111 RepID=UPI001004FF97|nr:30S ribosomal protein S2 [Metamycoplasma arthritidis]VEU78546.1 Vegetative protein 209 [Metamycoplasma arthritidis]